MSREAVRRLQREELPLALPLLAAEGWGFEAAELSRIHRHGGAVGAFAGGALIGFLSFLDTPPFRWIGNVAVAHAARGRGVARSMVEEATRDAPRCALYSVEKAVTLYARAGFAPAGDVLAMRATIDRQAQAAAGDRMTAADLPDVARFDAAKTGMDRRGILGELLAAYPSHARVARIGGEVAAYGFAKVYADVTEVGPIVARDEILGASLLDALVAGSRAPHEIAVHASNAGAVWAARARGFEPLFRAVAMFRGGAPAWDGASYFAAAGLEKG